MVQHFKFLCGGEWRESNDKLKVNNPYNGTLVAEVSRAQESDVEYALAQAVRAFETTRALPAYKRYRMLLMVAEKINEQKEDLARTISLESGKPIKDARAEAGRAVLTFTTAAEEAKRLAGEYMPLEFIEGAEKTWALVRRFPIGVILGITPFNFPLNLVAHKVAPALASGNTIIIRPASQTPLSALNLAKIIDETGWPKGGISVLPCTTQLGEKMVQDERVKKLSFTGSDAVGWHLKKLAWNKKVTLELGGNAGVVVHDDADLDFAVERILYGGFVQAGQSCISVQRIFLHDKIHDIFVEKFIERVKKLKIGDPLKDDTDIGPMIDENAAKKAEEWIKEAVADGARILYGGGRTGSILEPTVITNVKSTMKVCYLEIFAPVVTIIPYHDFESALKEVNNSKYGLQAGVFTRDIKRIFRAYEELEVGGVIINNVPTWRSDPMPYGGVKNSGVGREGIRYAIEEMTELKVMVLNLK
jgi:glyceraldehyde-3-phosphate dehydrogenase (NADP+)